MKIAHVWSCFLFTWRLDSMMERLLGFVRYSNGLDAIGVRPMPGKWSRQGWMARLGVLFVASLWLVIIHPFASVHAQDAPPVWEPAINLSNTPTQSEAPAIAADASGMVHVFWGENVDQSTNYSNAIFYTRWDGASWSPPRDIVLSPEGLTAVAGSPAVTTGRDGRLHLLFTSGWNSRLYYSAARADEAFSARAWTPPIELSQGMAGQVGHTITTDASGRLHVAYVVNQGIDQGVFYLHSDDDGATWSAPVRIAGSRLGSPYMLGDPALAIGHDGTLHVMWFWTTVKEYFPPKGLIYARSDDSGRTWSEPSHFADGPFRYPALATRGENEVHAVWSGTAEQRQKFYRWSGDNGRTWSSTTAIPDLGGFQGTAGMAVDSAGVLHLALVGSHPVYGDSLHHYWWNGSTWIGPQVLLQGTGLGASMASAAITISEGNRLHVVVISSAAVDGDVENDIFYARGRVLAPHVVPVSMPTVEHTPTPVPDVLPTVEPAKEVPPPGGAIGFGKASHFSLEKTPNAVGQGISAFITGLVAVLLILGIVVAARVLRRSGMSR